MGRRDRIIAAVAALAGWAGLALQLWLIIRNLGPALGIWRFLGFFTILTNIGAAVVATAFAIGVTGRLASARARLMAATSIVLVGIVYSVALRALWNPQGLQKLADVALHDAAPLLWLILWGVAPPPRLFWRDLFWALLPPLLYCIYAIARGSADGWYAYWFLNPAQQSPGELLASIAVLLACLAVIAAALVAYARWSSRLPATTDADRCALVDEAGRESFPASDPPSWTLGSNREP